VGKADFGDGHRKHTGRRAGPTVSSRTIVEAARAQFSRYGYEGTTTRTIAEDAGVDSALIHHFFLTKEGLFEAVVGDALDPPDLVDQVLAGPRAGLGERTLLAFLSHWDEPENRDRMLAVVRSITALDRAASALRVFLSDGVLFPLTSALGAPNPRERAAMVGAHLVGLMTMRYVYAAPPLATLSREDLATLMGPVIQARLVGSH